MSEGIFKRIIEIKMSTTFQPVVKSWKIVILLIGPD